MRKLIAISFLLLGTLALAGCRAISSGQAAATRDSAVTGTVTYLQRIALPLDAVVTVRIEDVSRADAPAVVIGEQVVKTKGAQVPIPFEVSYDPGEIVENHTYSMRARIEDRAGNLLFINDTSVPVITGGNPTQDVEIMVVPAGG
jgi:putative lipoprotein